MSSAAIRAGAAYIELTIRDKVTNGLKEASKRLQSFADELTNVGARVIALGAGIVAPLAAMAYQFAKTASPEALTAFDRLYGSLADLSQVVGGAVLPVISDLADRAARILDRVVDWTDSNRELIATIFKVGAALVAGGAAIIAVGKVVGFLAAGISALSVISGMLATSIGALGGVLAALATPIGLVVAGAAAIGLSLTYAGEAGGVALQWLSDAFGSLKDDALAAWGGIASALMSGDIAKAGEILWLELKLIWQKGINEIYGLWLTAVDFIQSNWIDAWALIETTFTDVFAYFSDELNEFLGEFQKGWGDATDWLAKRLLWLWGQFDETLDVAGAQREVDDAGARRNQGIDERTEEWRRDPEGMRQKRNAEIEAQRKKSQADRQAAFDSNLIAGDAEVQRRREAVQESIDEANNAVPTTPKPDFPSVASAIASDAANIESKGTFNALAAGLMGSDSLSERQAKAAESTAENTRRLLQMAQKGRIVFAN